jgi:hypothetical protein
MWLLLKLFITAGVILYRRSKKHFSGGDVSTFDISGVKCIRRIYHKKNSIDLYFEIECECYAIFKIGKENIIDKFFKGIGFSQEFQTGDATFDKKIYLISDHSSFNLLLKNQSEAREIIHSIIALGCQSICSDGKKIWVHFKQQIEESQSVMKLMVTFFHQLQMIEKSRVKRLKDPFIWKAIFTEALVWSILSYAFAGIFEFTMNDESLYLYPWNLFYHGLKFGGVIALGLLIFIYVFLNGSSRGHRIIMESFLLLGISIPTAGISLVSDLNIHLDLKPTLLVEADVTNLYIIEHRRKRNRGRSYSYHLIIEPNGTDQPIQVPREIQINRNLFDQLRKGSQVQIVIGQGWLNHPYFKNIRQK